MKEFLKVLSIFLFGVFLAAVLLYLYADVVFDSPGEGQVENLPEAIAPARPGEALITRISGEVFIIRDDEMLTPLPGDQVREGDIIKVVDDSLCQIRFAGTASLRIRSNTLVRIQTLLSGSRDVDIRTELLTGSMIYKVEELADSQNLQILAQERIYRVEGTEFMVQAFPNRRTSLAVLDGRVSIFSLDNGQNEQFLTTLDARQRIVLQEDDREEPEILVLSPEEEETFREEEPEELSIQREDLVYLRIAGRPGGAQIYINGRLNGSSAVTGLFLPEEELVILLRKRGYRDESLRIIPGELTDRNLVIPLTPLGADETIREEEVQSQTASPVELLRQRHQEELAELQSSFTQKLAAADNSLSSLRESETTLTQQNQTLQEELAQSREESRKLRELIRQIQELAGDQ